MKDKIILITGATSGIGFQTALSLAKMGAQVVVTGRSEKSAQEAVTKLKAESKNERVDFLLADLSAQKNVCALVEQFKARYERLDVLINNAGLASSKYELTEDGIESDFAVNVVAPFLLTHLLMDSLKKSLSPRVVTLMGGDVPAALEVPRVLKRSTASSASAGSRHAALRNRWESIIPPWVGSGWTHTIVAAGGTDSGTASSPTNSRPSVVCSVRGSRIAGSTEFAAILSTPAA